MTVPMLMVSEAEVQRLLDRRALLAALAEGFAALSAGRIIAPSRTELTIPETGFLLAMPASRTTAASHTSDAIFTGQQASRAEAPIAVKLVTVFSGNEQRGIPSHQALICLFDATTGTPLALMGGTAITALRTAAAAALSTQLLARAEAQTLAIIGAGVQGRAHLDLLPLVREFTDIRIASRQFAHAERLAAQHPLAHAVASIEEAVRGAEVVCLCTSAGAPVLQRAWLAPGTHLTSVGYHPPDGELPHEVIAEGHLFVETRLAFAPPPAGCGELRDFAPEHGTELGELVLGQRPRRQTADELTVYKAMGHAMEDLVAARLVYERAKREGAGIEVIL